METEIFEIIPKYLDNVATPEERQALEAWLKEDEDHSAIFDRVKLVWMKTAEPRITPTFDALRDWENVTSKITKTRSVVLTKRIFYVAASITIFLVMGYFLLNKVGTNHTYENNQSLLTIHELPDGSRVWVDKSSNFHFSQSDQIREVTLTGRAYFEVAHDKSKPFVIQTKRTTVEVLGTSFSLSDSPSGEALLSVTDGRVSFKTNLSEKSVIVQKGEQAFAVDKEIIISELNKNYLAWKTGEVEFENSSLAEAVSILNHQFPQEIKIANPAVSGCRFSAKFSGQSINEILEVISILLNLELTTTQNGYELIGNACS